MGKGCCATIHVLDKATTVKRKENLPQTIFHKILPFRVESFLGGSGHLPPLLHFREQ